jgi:hypothetical protein
MINTFIAYDDNDADFGLYFTESHSDVSSDFEKNVLVVNVSLNGLNCTEANINNVLQGMLGNSFVFIALSHGNEDEFWSHEVYLSSNNAHRLINAFLYSTACSTGKNLGKVLIDNGCVAFIGYGNEVNVLLNNTKLFYSCENYGIKSFLNNNETIGTSYSKLIDNYTEEIYKLFYGSIDDLIVASVLIGNRDSLVLLGNDSLTRDYFNLP